MRCHTVGCPTPLSPHLHEQEKLGVVRNAQRSSIDAGPEREQALRLGESNEMRADG